VAEHLHIIASCTDRKRWAAPQYLQLRRIPMSGAKTRARRWWDRVTESHSPAYPANALYTGGHWSVVQQLPPTAVAVGYRAHLWVTSAGYGLVPATCELHPYSATFTPGLPDSVCPHDLPAEDRSRYLRDWWRAMSDKRGPRPYSMRRVQDLARLSKNSVILVIASGNYVAAMEEDLLDARESLRHSDRLIVVSGRSAAFPRRILPNRVTVDARIQPILGGALATLGARLARDILRKAGQTTLSAGQLQRRYEALSKRQMPSPTRTGRPMSDVEVHAYLDRCLERNPESRHTPLLRALRDTGRSCEANRFRRLFLERRR
jgi:hypothetical protein